MTRAILIALGLLLLAPLLLYPLARAEAHDSWISRGGLRNPAGEWCCGDGDCALMDPKTVTSTSRGYHFNGIGRINPGSSTETVETYDELIREREIQPSPDGAYWRCKRPDGSRRCVFGPPPGS